MATTVSRAKTATKKPTKPAPKTTKKPAPHPETPAAPTTRKGLQDLEELPATASNYGNFNAFTGDIESPTIDYFIRRYLAGHVHRFHVDAIVADYVTQINSLLPPGVTLNGSEVVGPYPYDYELTQPIQAAFNITNQMLREISERHDKTVVPTGTAVL